MPDQKITDLTEATSVDGTEYVELVQSSTNKKAPTSLLITTREFNRTFSETINFDKNEIFYAPHVQTAEINFEIGSGLVDESSSALVTITADGVNPINFGLGFNFLYGITNGEILDEGTYEIYFLYINGSVRVNVPGVSAQESNAVVLQAPANFDAVADGETAIDLSWDDVENETSYLIEFSLTGTGGWSTLDTPAADAVTSTQTGLSEGNTRFYRIKAIGDGINFLDSPYSTASATTESSSDITAPTFTFSPASGVTTWTVNRPITITADEGIQNTDGSAITNANVSSRITLKETNSGGANIAFTATIDVTKTIITITPTTTFGTNQLVYVAINNVEDVNGNEVTVAVSSTFTTTEFTFFNGTSNRLDFGDILDSVFATVDTNFEIEITVNNPTLAGVRRLCAKIASSQYSFALSIVDDSIYFVFYFFASGSRFRNIQWPGVMTAGSHTILLQYDGSIDTNNGEDRVTLFIDAVEKTTKVMGTNSGDQTLGAIINTTAHLAVGVGVDASGTPIEAAYLDGEAKDFIVRSTAGSVEEINVPILKLGTDTSGNSRNGTWV